MHNSNQAEDICLHEAAHASELWRGCLNYVKADYPHVSCTWTDFSELAQEACLNKVFENME